MNVPKVCPLCESEGTVVFEKVTRRVVSRGGYKGEAQYEHHVCHCSGCGDWFITVEMMNGNLHRMREAIEKQKETHK